ncbi:hypothetical protein GCK32_020397, partial [Trichostrongylus colubriformis]
EDLTDYIAYKVAAAVMGHDQRWERFLLAKYVAIQLTEDFFASEHSLVLPDNVTNSLRMVVWCIPETRKLCYRTRVRTKLVFERSWSIFVRARVYVVAGHMINRVDETLAFTCVFVNTQDQITYHIPQTPF